MPRQTYEKWLPNKYEEQARRINQLTSEIAQSEKQLKQTELLSKWEAVAAHNKVPHLLTPSEKAQYAENVRVSAVTEGDNISRRLQEAQEAYRQHQLKVEAYQRRMDKNKWNGTPNTEGDE